MFGTYQRLQVSAFASPREVIRAAQGKLKPESKYSREQREARHAFYRMMLDYHAKAADLARWVR
jgi:uncharacterized protein (DUF305 family)